MANKKNKVKPVVEVRSGLLQETANELENLSVTVREIGLAQDDIYKTIKGLNRRLVQTEQAIHYTIDAGNSFARHIKFTIGLAIVICLLSLFLSMFSIANASEPSTIKQCKAKCIEYMNQADRVINMQNEAINYMGSHIKKQATDLDLMVAELDYSNQELIKVKATPFRNPWILIPLGFITGYVVKDYVK